MFAFVVLGSVFQYQAITLARKNILKMTCFYVEWVWNFTDLISILL